MEYTKTRTLCSRRHRRCRQKFVGPTIHQRHIPWKLHTNYWRHISTGEWTSKTCSFFSLCAVYVYSYVMPSHDIVLLAHPPACELVSYPADVSLLVNRDGVGSKFPSISSISSIAPNQFPLNVTFFVTFISNHKSFIARSICHTCYLLFGWVSESEWTQFFDCHS